MKDKSLSRSRTVVHYLLIGLGLAALSWFLTSLAEAYLFQEDPLIEELFLTEADDLWESLVVVMIIVAFSGYVGRVFAQRNRAEEKLNFQKTVLEAQGEASVDGILVVSPEGNMISFNLFPMSSSYWST